MRDRSLTGYADPLSVAPGETVRFGVGRADMVFFECPGGA